MKKPFDCVVLSTNLDPDYCDHFPLVAAAWRALFGVPVHLLVVADRSCNPDRFRGFGSVGVVPDAKGVPAANQAKLARYYASINLSPWTVAMFNDVDLMPLSRGHFEGACAGRPAGTLLAFGSELYTGAEAGKFLAGPMVAEAGVVQSLFGLSKPWPTWAEFVRRFTGRKVLDGKEDVAKPTPAGDPDCFSDESLIRSLLHERSLSGDPIPVLRRQASWFPAGTLDRSRWDADWERRLAARQYVEAHLPKGLSAHRERLRPLATHIGIEMPEPWAKSPASPRP